MIPKIIHQIWLGNKKKKPFFYMRKWEKLNPTWEYYMWSERNLFPLINQHHFNNIESYAGKSDILRYEILAKYGGFYIDADTNPLIPLDDDLIRNDIFACYDNDRAKADDIGVSKSGVCWKKKELVANGFLAAYKNHTFLNQIIQELHNRTILVELFHDKGMTYDNSWILTGPIFLTEMIKKYKVPIKIYPSYYFLPDHPSGSKYNGTGKIYCKHFWGGTNQLAYSGTKIPYI